MATETTNYGLIKPDLTDQIDVEQLNGNFDKIDEEIKKAADAIPPVATTEKAGIVKPDGTTVYTDPDGTLHGAQTYVLPPATPNTLGGVMIGANLTIGENGKLNAYANIQTDAVPTANSQNVPLSGGTYSMIHGLTVMVNNLNGQVVSLTTGLTWKTAVSTFADIATTYGTPELGWTVNCLDTGYTYQYDGTSWILIFASTVPVASVEDVWDVLEGRA